MNRELFYTLLAIITVITLMVSMIFIIDYINMVISGVIEVESKSLLDSIKAVKP